MGHGRWGCVRRVLHFFIGLCLPLNFPLSHPCSRLSHTLQAAKELADHFPSLQSLAQGQECRRGTWEVPQEHAVAIQSKKSCELGPRWPCQGLGRIGGGGGGGDKERIGTEGVPEGGKDAMRSEMGTPPPSVSDLWKWEIS